MEEVPENGSADARVLFFVNSCEGGGLGEYKSKFHRLLATLRLGPSSWRYHVLSEDKGREALFEEFKEKVFPLIRKTPPKVVITFGEAGAYPFFKKEADSDPDWFKDMHTRWHEKKVPGQEEPFYIYCLPSFDTCVDEESVRPIIQRSVRVIRGMLADLRLISLE